MKIIGKFIKALFNFYLLLWITSVFFAIKSINQILIIGFTSPIIVYYVLGLWRKKVFIAKARRAMAFLALISSFLILIANIGNARNINNLLVSFSVVPIFFYFLTINLDVLVIFLAKQKIKKIEMADAETNAENEIVSKDTVDEKRRKFIKIVAGFGLSGLLLYLVNPKKAQGAFFGSMPGPGTIAIKDTSGTKIDPAIKSPTDGYGLTNVVDSGDYPYYYGFVNKDGAWYIMKEVGDGSYLYAKGASGYNWSNRASQSYASYDATF